MVLEVSCTSPPRKICMGCSSGSSLLYMDCWTTGIMDRFQRINCLFGGEGVRTLRLPRNPLLHFSQVIITELKVPTMYGRGENLWIGARLPACLPSFLLNAISWDSKSCLGSCKSITKSNFDSSPLLTAELYATWRTPFEIPFGSEKSLSWWEGKVGHLSWKTNLKDSGVQGTSFVFLWVVTIFWNPMLRSKLQSQTATSTKPSLKQMFLWSANSTLLLFYFFNQD